MFVHGLWLISQCCPGTSETLTLQLKRSLVFKYLQQHSPKICILQETPLVGSRVMGLKRAWVCAHYHASYSNYARGGQCSGAQILSNSWPLELIGGGGRYVLLHALIEWSPYVIVGIYLPPPLTLLHTVMHVAQFDVDRVLLVGDFNLVMSNELDRLRPSSPTSPGLSQWAPSFHLTYL